MAQVGLGGRVEELRISVRLEMDPCDCCWSACPWTRSLDLDLAFRALLEGRDEKPAAELGLVMGREDGGDPI
jgi:epoxyqueuosine reductase QueG